MGTVLTLIAFFGICWSIVRPNISELAWNEYEEDER
jgi:hypothetical protein